MYKYIVEIFWKYISQSGKKTPPFPLTLGSPNGGTRTEERYVLYRYHMISKTRFVCTNLKNKVCLID